MEGSRRTRGGSEIYLPSVGAEPRRLIVGVIGKGTSCRHLCTEHGLHPAMSSMLCRILQSASAEARIVADAAEGKCRWSAEDYDPSVFEVRGGTGLGRKQPDAVGKRDRTDATWSALRNVCNGCFQ